MTTRIETHDDRRIVLYVVVDGPDGWRAKAILWPSAGSSEWLLGEILTREGYERQGHGRAMVGEVREWAAEHGYTVRTRNAMPEAYGFYEKCGCQKIDDDDGDVEYLVAPVPG